MDISNSFSFIADIEPMPLTETANEFRLKYQKKYELTALEKVIRLSIIIRNG